MDSVKCVFESKLSVTDIGKLNQIVGAVIPILHEQVLITPNDVGLYRFISPRTDYTKLKLSLKTMKLTVMRRLEGNQMILTRLQHGNVYSVRNTGPFNWEKGDRLTTIPPMFTVNHTSVIQFGNWELILPMVVPVEVSRDINVRNVVYTFLSTHKSFKEYESIYQDLHKISFRDVTIELPLNLDTRHINDVKNVCVALSMITNLTTGLVANYLSQLAMIETDSLIVKCQELLRSNNVINIDEPINPTQEYKKLYSLLNLMVQVGRSMQEEASFVVLDVTPDNKIATCMFLQK